MPMQKDAQKRMERENAPFLRFLEHSKTALGHVILGKEEKLERVMADNFDQNGLAALYKAASELAVQAYATLSPENQKRLEQELTGEEKPEGTGVSEINAGEPAVAQEVEEPQGESQEIASESAEVNETSVASAGVREYPE